MEESTLGARMRQARGERSQTDIGAAVADATARPEAFTKGAVSQWEAGETEPSTSALIAFAKITGADLMWLMTGQNEAPISSSSEDLFEKLDALFASVDTKLAAIREVLAIHTTRFTALERKLDQVAAATAEILRKLTE